MPIQFAASLPPLPEYLAIYISLMDQWVLVVTVLTLTYLVVNLPRFENKGVATMYIGLLTLLTFNGIRNLGVQLYTAQIPTVLYLLSLVVDTAVIALSGYLFYVYWQQMDINTLLEQLELGAAVEDAPDPDAEPEFQQVGDLVQGYTYLFMEDGRENSFTSFRGAVSEVPGICFSRSHPSKLERRHDLDETPLFWFSEREDVEGVNVIEPFRLNFLKEVILEFIEENDASNTGSVLMIDGTEYLIYKNPFEKIMNFFEDLNDHISEHQDVTMIVALDPESLDTKKLSFLREEFDEVRKAGEDGMEELHY